MGIRDRAGLDKAKKQARGLFAYRARGISRQGFLVAFSGDFPRLTLYENYLEHLDAVTLDDVHAAARQYLRPSQRTVGWFVPVPDGEGGNHAQP